MGVRVLAESTESFIGSENDREHSEVLLKNSDNINFSSFCKCHAAQERAIALSNAVK